MQKCAIFLSAAALLIPIYGEAKRNGWLPDAGTAKAFPSSGSVTVNRSVDPRSATSPLQLEAGDANAVVQLYDVATQAHVISVYVARARTVRVHLPPGIYKVGLVEGDKWHGPVKYFGSSTAFETVRQPLVFESHQGHRISLVRTPSGNLRTTYNIRAPAPI